LGEWLSIALLSGVDWPAKDKARSHQGRARGPKVRGFSRRRPSACGNLKEEVVMSKRFFYICAGILCLTVAYEIGAVNAVAQGPLRVDGATIQELSGGGVRASGVVDRKFYYIQDNGVVHPYTTPIPGKDRIVATNPGYAAVMLENGDWLQWNGTDWARIGNLVGQ
jgi:hypothetical protein